MSHTQIFAFYPIIIALGLFTSYTDIKFRKIRNKHLFFATVLGLAAYIYLTADQKNALNSDLILNLLVGTGIGLLLYFTDTWGAGDAKLFAVFCLLMPIEKYSHILPYASIALFVNIFVLSTLVFLFLSIVQIINTNTPIFKTLFSADTLQNIGRSFAIIICLNWTFAPILHFLVPNVTLMLHIITMYFYYHMIHKILENRVDHTTFRTEFSILGLGLLARLFFQPSDFIGINLVTTLKYTIAFTFIFHTMRVILETNTSNDEKKRNIPFAPLIFLGALLTNTNFLNSIMSFFKFPK